MRITDKRSSLGTFFGGNFFLVLLFFLFSSCSDECRQVEIEKAEWVTRDSIYSVDTLATYSVVRDYIRFDDRPAYDPIGVGANPITRVIEIKNHSDFPGSFAIGSNDNFSYTGANEYRVIPPHRTAVFYLSSSIYRGRRDRFYFESEISILQSKQKRTFICHIDELVLSKITVNSCEQSIQALKREYKTVKELYYKKADARGNKVIQALQFVGDPKMLEK